MTAVPKEVIEDKGVRDLRDLARETPGLTIGSAEGGNAYGAFAIRGFKANNDIFVDSIRNPGNVSSGRVRRRAGRDLQGSERRHRRAQHDRRRHQPHHQAARTSTSISMRSATTVGTDSTFRTTIDANQVVTPDFAVRANLMYDQHDVAGRDIRRQREVGRTDFGDGEADRTT